MFKTKRKKKIYGLDLTKRATLYAGEKLFWSPTGGAKRDDVLNNFRLVGLILRACWHQMELKDVFSNVAMISSFFLMCYGYMITYYFDHHDKMYYMQHLQSKMQSTFGKFQLLNWKYLKHHWIYVLL